MMAWVLFRADDFTHAWGYFTSLYTYKEVGLNYDVLHKFMNREVYLVLLIAVLSSTKLWVVIYERAKKFVQHHSSMLKLSQGLWMFMVIAFVLVVRTLSTTYLVANSYNPFIYFRF